jgi:hypothetical protein
VHDGTVKVRTLDLVVSSPLRIPQREGSRLAQLPEEDQLVAEAVLHRHLASARPLRAACARLC